MFLLQTSHSALGVALHFKNYILKTKDMKGCDFGWWKINEVMYVDLDAQVKLEK